MAAFGNNNQNNNKKAFIQEHYSSYSMSNPESPVDQTKLSFSFWAGKLKISISPKKNSENLAYDYENNIAVFMTHTKARIFANLIRTKLLNENEKDIHNVGVSTGSNGLIILSDGSDYNVNSPCLTIANTDNDTGDIKSMYVYQMKYGIHYGIVNYDKNTKKCDTIDIDNVEIEELLTMLDSYVESATGAIAASVAEEAKYDMSRLNTKVNDICEKLGITYNTSSANYTSSGSYFDKTRKDNNESTPFKGINKPEPTTIDNLDDGLK